MESRVITIQTGGREAVHDLTEACSAFLQEVDAAEVGAAEVRAAEVRATEVSVVDPPDGLLHVWVPHATAGLAILETGSGSEEDLLVALDELLPRDDRWRHRHGSAGHGRDHVLPALLPPYATVPVLQGRMALGTWQRVCLVDTNVDNPSRNVRLSLLTSG